MTGVDDDLPLDSPTLELYRPVPNPFNNGVRLAYEVPTASATVSIKVFDLAGRLVRTLAADTQSAGRYVVAWNGRDERGATIRSGMYFIQVRISGRRRKGAGHVPEVACTHGPGNRRSPLVARAAGGDSVVQIPWLRAVPGVRLV